MEREGLETHLWVGNHSREIRIAGEPIILYLCPICSRDFARLLGRSNWKAIRVSTFNIMFLPDAITQQWLKEPCPRSTPPSAEKLENARENRKVKPWKLPGLACRLITVRVRGPMRVAQVHR